MKLLDVLKNIPIREQTEERSIITSFNELCLERTLNEYAISFVRENIRKKFKLFYKIPFVKNYICPDEQDIRKEAETIVSVLVTTWVETLRQKFYSDNITEIYLGYNLCYDKKQYKIIINSLRSFAIEPNEIDILIGVIQYNFLKLSFHTTVKLPFNMELSNLKPINDESFNESSDLFVVKNGS